MKRLKEIADSLGFNAVPIGLIYSFSPVYFIPYMKQIPEVEWSFDGGGTWEYWSRDYICNINKGADYRYDYDSIDTVHNWMTKMDLICLSDSQIGIFGTLFFLGWVIGAVSLLGMGDIFGRKKTLIVSVTGMALMLVGLIFVDNMWLLYANLFAMGIFNGSKGALAYLYMLELSPANIRPILHMFAMSTEATLEILEGLLIWWVQDGFYVILVIVVGNFGLMFIIFLSPESPKFLHAKRRWDELHKTLNYIAKINGVK